MIAGMAVVILQIILFKNLIHSNSVDSNSQTVYINGFESFRWPSFIGIGLFMAGVITIMVPWTQKGHRMN